MAYCRNQNKEKSGALHLPFTDAAPKTGAVVSKIPMLVNDQKIKDRDIFSQLEPATE